jgi:hypothetical protein
MWVKGFAQGAADMGGEVTVETMSGRLVSGRLFAVNPGYFHTFGRPIPELARVGRDLRAQVAQYRATLAAGEGGVAGQGGVAGEGGVAGQGGPAGDGGAAGEKDGVR